MIQLEAVRLWGVPGFVVPEGKIISSSGNCVWCDNATGIGEFVLGCRSYHNKKAPAMQGLARVAATGLEAVTKGLGFESLP